ncbi:MAG: hypothetical protein ACE5I3_01365 [Phycisphaerae bacterium]
MSVDRRQIEVLDAEMARLLQRKTGAERLQIAWSMFSSARRMIISMLRAEHPNWDERQVNAEAARRLSHGAI